MMYFHSVSLDSEKCQGCTNCVKGCPTEAIRVRDGKARIIKERCIDCGECIRICPYHAKRSVTDPRFITESYKYNIIMTPPSFYGQFKGVSDVNVILTALKKLGFDDVYEVARGAEYVTAATTVMMRKGMLPKPAISSACPVINRLISIRFPDLIDNIVKLISPMEVAAEHTRREAIAKTGLDSRDIGVFFITPCPAKMTSIRTYMFLEEAVINGAFSVNDIYAELLPIIKTIDKPEKIARESIKGISWGRGGGESAGVPTPHVIHADGIGNAIKILEQIENDKIDADFVELCSCPGGCVGGPLNVENPFVAASRMENMIVADSEAFPLMGLNIKDMLWRKDLEPVYIMRLDDNFLVAMEKMQEIERIYETLPKLDCGACGSPSCRAMAEDIVRGVTCDKDCIVKMREEMMRLLKKESSDEGI
ncbi:MAG: 4Fe-4S binding protein [Clostridia bacterium]|nr:4Fe-4S binding protein [Clostridia bacterium]